MSYESYVGFIKGMVTAMVVGVIVLVVRAKRRAGVEYDERSSLVRMRAAEWSFYMAVFAAFAAWVADNLQAGQRGEAITFFSPVGILFWTMAIVYLLALGYSFYINSGSLFDGNWRKLAAVGSALFGAGSLLRQWNIDTPVLPYVIITLLLGGIACFHLSIRQWRTQSK